LSGPSGRYLSFAEREEIALLRAHDRGVREIARLLDRDPATISRELRRNAATRGGQLEYRASVAQWKADLAARRPKTAKLATNDQLRDYVQDRLAGTVTDAEGRPVPGPNVPWKGRRHGRRADRRWGVAWSPEQISRRLRVDFPEDESMRISHEAIYQSLYVQGRGGLKRELSACLRTGRALRVPRARTRGRGKHFLRPELMISQRPAEVEDRAVPGHWEGDLIIGLEKSAIGTLVERTTRFTILLHLPHDHTAATVAAAMIEAMGELPEHLRRSITWDRGSEMAQWQHIQMQINAPVFFCHPHSPWQRGTNENTNRLLRFWFEKGTDLSSYTKDDLKRVQDKLNSRPRPTLDLATPAQSLAVRISQAA